MSEPREWVVVYYLDARGHSPVKAFVDGLQPAERVSVERHLDWLRRFGVFLDMPQARPLRGKLWELRPGNYRVLYYYYNVTSFRKSRFYRAFCYPCSVQHVCSRESAIH